MKTMEKKAAVTAGRAHVEDNLSESDILSFLEDMDEKVSETAKGSMICRSPAPVFTHIDLPEEMDDSFCDIVLSFLDDVTAKAGCKPDTPTNLSKFTWKKDKTLVNWSTSPEFISEWIESHESGFRRIAEPYFKNIRDSAYSLEDFVQEIRLAVFRAFDSYDPYNAEKTDPESYFYIVARNQMKQLCRTISQKHRDSSNNISLDSCYFEETDDASDDLDAPLRVNPHFISKDNVEDAVIFQDAIFSSIKGRQRIVLELTAMGYRQVEIADYLGLSQSSISYDIQQIRKEIM